MAVGAAGAASRRAVLRHRRALARAPIECQQCTPALRRTAARAGVWLFAPHRLRHAHAVEMAREGVPLNVIRRQLGHVNLGITSVYLQGIDNAEIIGTVYARRAPMLPASAGLAWHAGRTVRIAPDAAVSAGGCWLPVP